MTGEPKLGGAVEVRPVALLEKDLLGREDASALHGGCFVRGNARRLMTEKQCMMVEYDRIL